MRVRPDEWTENKRGEEQNSERREYPLGRRRAERGGDKRGGMRRTGSRGA